MLPTSWPLISRASISLASISPKWTERGVHWVHFLHKTRPKWTEAGSRLAPKRPRKASPRACLIFSSARPIRTLDNVSTRRWVVVCVGGWGSSEGRERKREREKRRTNSTNLKPRNLASAAAEASLSPPQTTPATAAAPVGSRPPTPTPRRRFTVYRRAQRRSSRVFRASPASTKTTFDAVGLTLHRPPFLSLVTLQTHPSARPATLDSGLEDRWPGTQPKGLHRSRKDNGGEASEFG